MSIACKTDSGLKINLRQLIKELKRYPYHIQLNKIILANISSPAFFNIFGSRFIEGFRVQG
jgi:hypothetical protein